MGKNKHTPGPWRLGDAGHAVFGPKDSGMYPNAPITIVQKIANKANAALIANAPEMFSLIIRLRAELENVLSGEIQRGAIEFEINEASKLISKAEGGT